MDCRRREVEALQSRIKTAPVEKATEVVFSTLELVWRRSLALAYVCTKDACVDAEVHSLAIDRKRHDRVINKPS